ncbi:MAG: SPOR domain-containing protein [Chryseobacterium sp.]|nr:MAG: SPOR domain-containing protein [Chryseobacterium sp.]
MKYVKILPLFLSFFISVTLGAQNVVTKTDSLGNNSVSFTMDNRLANLLESQVCKTNVGTSTAATQVPDTPPRTSTGSTTTAPRAMTTAEICARNPKLMGFKIQVAVVKSREEANKIGLAVRQRFPGLRVEMDALLRPNYKVLAGSFFTRESGSADLRQVRSAYPGAILIPYRIFCAEAK